MTWSYSGDPSKSDLDAVRFAIADVDKEDPQLSDEEIFAMNKVGGSVNKGILKCLEYLIAKYARAIDYKIGPEHVYASKKYEHYLAFYKVLKLQYQSSSLEPQEPQTPGAISFGFMDNKGGI